MVVAIAGMLKRPTGCLRTSASLLTSCASRIYQRNCATEVRSISSLGHLKLGDLDGRDKLPSDLFDDSTLDNLGKKAMLKYAAMTNGTFQPTAELGSMLTGVGSPFSAVQRELERLSSDVKTFVGADHPVLDTVAQYLFRAGGKRIRPLMVLLVAKACSTSGDVLSSQQRLAVITEMIHTASLVHDDVIDEADMRRGEMSVNAKFGNKVAVLAGDFLLARASLALARLQNVEVIELMSLVIEHLTVGEMMQMKRITSDANTFDYYMSKNFCKTASLIANSCKSAVLLGQTERDEGQAEAAYQFGRHTGLAFQLVDDLLDYVGSSDEMGKESFSDLRMGIPTAPVFYAMDEFPELRTMAERQFSLEGDADKAIELVLRSNSIDKVRDLAAEHCNRAIDVAMELPESQARDSLVSLTNLILTRQK